VHNLCPEPPGPDFVSCFIIWEIEVVPGGEDGPYFPPGSFSRFNCVKSLRGAYLRKKGQEEWRIHSRCGGSVPLKTHWEAICCLGLCALCLCLTVAIPRPGLISESYFEDEDTGQVVCLGVRAVCVALRLPCGGIW
jgi:hypothetical protein